MENRKKKISKKKAGIICGAAAGAAVLILAGRQALLERSGATKQPVYVTAVEQLALLGTGNGSVNRFAGVVESQETWSAQQNSEKTVKEILVKAGDQVQVGTPLYTYDTEKFREDLAQAQIDLERISNEISGMSESLAELEAERARADESSRASYTFQIQEQELQLKQKQFDAQSKQMEIDRLNDNISNAAVTSQIDGVVKSVGEGNPSSGAPGGDAFITVMKTGAYRIKGTVNEQNMSSLTEGTAVLIHSRTDENLCWKGTVSKIDRENPAPGNGNYAVSSEDSSNITASSHYPFYVELESGDGLMLGQHVYLEPDVGQGQSREGIWLDEYMIDQTDPQQPFVWADNGNGRLEKRMVSLGDYDEGLMKYEIVSGLERTDAIAFPDPELEAGAKTEVME